jgi:hypothetical protein
MQVKKIVQLSAILSWVNLIIGSVLVVSALFSGLLLIGLANAITPIVMWGSIILHSYAAIQLRKSIVTSIPLNRQTGIGIRFIGYIAMFIALLWAGSGILLIQHAKELAQQLAKQIQLPPEYKNMDMSQFSRGMGIFFLLLSLSVITNVMLNFRLLRWYYLSRQEE